MNIKILLLAISATAFASCNTAYKSGQTPDDVYFSPARVIEEDTKKEEQKDQATIESIEDREIRMKIRDRRWRDLNNDYDCNCSCDYHPYKYGYNYGYYYNPYYYQYPVYNSAQYINPKNTTPRMTNLGGYNSVTTAAVVNPKTGKKEYVRKERTYNNSNNTPVVREIFTPSSSNSRTYSPSTSSSSSSSNSGGRSVSRPARH